MLAGFTRIDIFIRRSGQFIELTNSRMEKIPLHPYSQQNPYPPQHQLVVGGNRPTAIGEALRNPVLRVVLRRLLLAVPLLFVVSALSFLLSSPTVL